MRFFSIKNQEESLLKSVKKRWLPSRCGLILDSQRHFHPVWKVDSNVFDLFFAGIEKRSGLSLGRRLAHAASESEEWISILSKVSFPKSRNLGKWNKTRRDWYERGLGDFQLIDDKGEIKVLIKYPLNGPLCSGILSSNWEKATSKRHKFRWNHDKFESLILIMVEDDIEIPKPSKIHLQWFNETVEFLDQEFHGFWDSLEFESDKYLTIMGRRFAMINQDTILRFENYFLPYLSETYEQGTNSFVWEGIEKNRSMLWSIFSDSIRGIFYDQGHHILISESNDWINVSKRHLARQGLGIIESVTPIDDFGGIEICFNSCYHPALFCGVISGCWERANGRSVLCKFFSKDECNIVRLMSSHENSS
tara:strand:- start:258 stop:1349 length:1092 start_codon:yes stop_codon:yes gene_type:complete